MLEREEKRVFSYAGAVVTGEAVVTSEAIATSIKGVGVNSVGVRVTTIKEAAVAVKEDNVARIVVAIASYGEDCGDAISK